MARRIIYPYHRNPAPRVGWNLSIALVVLLVIWAADHVLTRRASLIDRCVTAEIGSGASYDQASYLCRRRHSTYQHNDSLE